VSEHPLGWHSIEGQHLLDTLRRVAAGEDPDLVYAELWANAEREQIGAREHVIEALYDNGWPDKPAWKVVCSCGWEAWDRPTETEVRADYDDHRNTETKQ